MQIAGLPSRARLRGITDNDPNRTVAGRPSALGPGRIVRDAENMEGYFRKGEAAVRLGKVTDGR